ncbi:MAG: aldo/keto reductase [Promethearchaeota archaeon]
MKYSKIPKTSKKISKIGFGSRQLKLIGKEDGLKKLIDTALDLGINFFCTSSNYQEGKVEAKLGQLLSGIRDEVIVATSGGVSHRDGKIIVDSSPVALEKGIQQSLKNLKTDYLDHFEIHLYDPITPLEESLSYLSDLLENGTIKSVGTSCFYTDILRKWQKLIPTSLVQVPLNPIQRKVYDSVIGTCQELDIGIIAYSPLFSGFLAKKLNEFPSNLNKLFDAPDSWQNCLMKLTHKLAELSKETKITISQLILNWILAHEELTCVLVGTNDIDHLRENVSVVDNPISDSLVKRINKTINTEVNLSQIDNIDNRPKLEAIIESISTNYNGKLVANFESGLRIMVPQQFKVGTKLYLDIETGELIKHIITS